MNPHLAFLAGMLVGLLLALLVAVSAERIRGRRRPSPIARLTQSRR